MTNVPHRTICLKIESPVSTALWEDSRTFRMWELAEGSTLLWAGSKLSQPSHTSCSRCVWMKHKHTWLPGPPYPGGPCLLWNCKPEISHGFYNLVSSLVIQAGRQKSGSYNHLPTQGSVGVTPPIPSLFHIDNITSNSLKTSSLCPSFLELSSQKKATSVSGFYNVD